MGVWRVAQRLGQAAASYSEAISGITPTAAVKARPPRRPPPRYYQVWMAVLSVCKCARAGDGGRAWTRYRRCRPWRTVVFAK